MKARIRDSERWKCGQSSVERDFRITRQKRTEATELSEKTRRAREDQRTHTPPVSLRSGHTPPLRLRLRGQFWLILVKCH
jgi:hypothetical protein